MSHACTTISTPVATAYDTLGEAGLTHSLNEPNCVGIFTNAELLPTLARVVKETPSVRLVVYDGDAKPTLLDQIRGVREDIVVVSVDKLRQTGRAQPLLKDRVARRAQRFDGVDGGKVSSIPGMCRLHG